MKSSLLKINLLVAFLSQFRVPIFAEETNTNSGRGRLALSLAIAYILMIGCLVIFIKTKKYADQERAKQQEQEKELKPWQKPNKYTNFPFDIFDRKGRQ